MSANDGTLDLLPAHGWNKEVRFCKCRVCGEANPEWSDAMRRIVDDLKQLRKQRGI